MYSSIISLMSTTGSCKKCGYQAKPRKDYHVDMDAPVCPKCNNELT